MNRLTIKVVLLFCLLTAGASQLAFARTNYVVIGVFRNHDNAIHFTDAARAHHFDASYKLNTVRKLYFVYVMHTEDVRKAIDEVLKLRSNSEYTGAWVYHGVLGEGQTHDGVEIKTTWPGNSPPPLPSDTIKSAPAAIVIGANTSPASTSPAGTTSATASSATTTVLTAAAVTGSPASTTIGTDSAAAMTEVKTVVATEMPEAGAPLDPKALTKVFIFKAYTSDKKPKSASVEVIDIDREKKVSVFEANEPVVVKAINASGDMRFDCQVAGYRKVTQSMNFKDPGKSEAGIVVEGEAIIVPFELVRLKKGDKEILYNIYFYKDAAIMRPESKYELDELLAMMNENGKYRIRIHGHTNGKASGKIIEPGETKNFFSLSGTKDGFGSAKALSEERATLIRDYLVSEGIDASRMEIKAWGGKKPIYDRDHALAHSNVRVEIEILQD